ncbi:hypothetical protein ABC347_16710 [Sphingomonas sp. 1P06PA]|uniref:hypothetical protein n=1 Tax=Sphingomonas sp. 1P06PA TaxID=554121 RepID=UPI0039A6DE38
MRKVHDPFDPGLRGYQVMYRPGAQNPCPGCGHSHWYVGRLTAECAFCATALPIASHGNDGWAMRAA